VLQNILGQTIARTIIQDYVFSKMPIGEVQRMAGRIGLPPDIIRDNNMTESETDEDRSLSKIPRLPDEDANLIKYFSLFLNLAELETITNCIDPEFYSQRWEYAHNAAEILGGPEGDVEEKDEKINGDDDFFVYEKKRRRKSSIYTTVESKRRHPIV